MICPNCGKEQFGGLACQKCGIIFSKIKQLPPSESLITQTQPEPKQEPELRPEPEPRIVYQIPEKEPRPAVTAGGLFQALGVMVLFFGGLIYFLSGSGPASTIMAKQLSRSGDEFMQQVHNKVAEDAVHEYRMAKRHGSQVEICVQAGMVVAAYRQAHDESNYAHWREIESDDCSSAGIKY